MLKMQDKVMIYFYDIFNLRETAQITAEIEICLPEQAEVFKYRSGEQTRLLTFWGIVEE